MTWILPAAAVELAVLVVVVLVVVAASQHVSSLILAQYPITPSESLPAL